MAARFILSAMMMLTVKVKYEMSTIAANTSEGTFGRGCTSLKREDCTHINLAILHFTQVSLLFAAVFSAMILLIISFVWRKAKQNAAFEAAK